MAAPFDKKKLTQKRHAERMSGERRLAALREEQEAEERRYNGKGEAQVVLGVQLSKVLKEWHDGFKLHWDEDRGRMHGPMDWLKEMTGLNVRRCHGLVNGEFPTVSLTQAELVLMAIGREYLLANGELHVIPNPNWSLEKWTTYMEERGCI